MKSVRAFLVITATAAAISSCSGTGEDRKMPTSENKKQDVPVTTYTGTLRTGMMAIGGETTGVLLETSAGTFELDLRQSEEANAKAESLNGKKVVVTGDYRPRAGVEVKERRIIVVRTLQPAK